MGINNFLNQVNSTVGENMRFVREFQANRQAGNTSSSSSAGNNESPMEMLSTFMMMMLLFQMYGPSMGQGNPSPVDTSPLGPLVDPFNNTGIPLQNPAYQFLNNQLTKQGQANGVDFEDELSIQRRMTEIVSTSKNGTVHDLVAQLKTTNPSAPEFLTIHARIEELLALEGIDSEEYELLKQAILANYEIDKLSIMATGNPSEELTSQIQQLKQQRETLATDWQELYSGSSLNEEDLAAKTLEALKKGQFTEVQLGQSLKYLLDKTPDANIEKVGWVIRELMEAGELNIAPFLNSDYLDRLSLPRQTALLQAVESSGLILSSGKPNGRFIGFMIDQMAKPGTSTTKAFLQQFLQDFYDVHGENPTTQVGRTLADILRLANIEADEEGQLVFS